MAAPLLLPLLLGTTVAFFWHIFGRSYNGKVPYSEWPWRLIWLERALLQYN